MAISELRNASTVGCSAMRRYGNTVGEVLRFDGCGYDQLRIDFLRLLVRKKIQDIFNGTYVPDHINTFVKMEPHKDEKIREGRLRLIMAVSLEDTMVDRMLYAPIAARAVASWPKTPVKLGYNPIGGNYRHIAAAFPGGTLSIDKKAWDFSVPGWMVNIWRQFLSDLAGDVPLWWLMIHEARFKALYSPSTLFEFKDGTIARQGVEGVMKSGCYLTILLNSVGQYIIAYLANCRIGAEMGLMWIVGDDTAERPRKDLIRYLEALRGLGFDLKEPEEYPYVEFCGFLANVSSIRPAYWKKHLFKVFYEDTGDHYRAKLDIYLFFYAFDERMFAVLKQVYQAKFGVSPKPVWYYKALWSGAISSESAALAVGQ